MTIKDAITTFEWAQYTQPFRLSDLTAYVRGVRQETCSPESVGRTLRKMRTQGYLNYAVFGNGEEYQFSE